MSCVLTLVLDDVTQARFETMRRQWFPPERNQIPAHLTLFHTLAETHATLARVQAEALRTTAFAMRVNAVRSLGRGVAYFLESREAVALQRQLAASFHDALSAQDRQGFRPHVVIQNRVEPDVAKRTLAVLQAEFQAWTCNAVGMELWRYLGGPWQHLRRFHFSSAAGERG